MFTSHLDKNEVERLAANIRYLMLKEGIRTNTDLAARSGISATHINRLVKAQMDAPTIATLRALANVFNVYWASLIDLNLEKANQDNIQPEAYRTWAMGGSYDDLVSRTKKLANNLEESIAKAIRTSRELYPEKDIDPKTIAEVAATLANTSVFSNERDDSAVMTISLLNDVRNA